ncbi:acetyl-CoA C-acetyltransferase, partial [Cryptococcus neoformans]
NTPPICGPLIVRAPPARFSAINNHARLSPSFITKPQTRPHNGQPRVHRLRLPNPRRRKGRRPRHPLRPATRCRRRQARRRQGRYQARASRGALHGQRRPGWCRAVSRQAGRYRCRYPRDFRCHHHQQGLCQRYEGHYACRPKHPAWPEGCHGR